MKKLLRHNGYLIYYKLPKKLYHKLQLSLKKALVKNSIQVYNEERPHYSNFFLTPEQMHQQREIVMKTYKKQKTEYQNDSVPS